MFNYIKADLYRIFRKKSMYMYFGILAIGYILMLVIFSITEGGKILGEISPIFMLVSLFGGGYLFATVYNDDLTAKTLPALIGFGIKRRMIVIAKFIVHTLMTLLLCLGTLLLIYITLILL
ncbi:MAG: hypothetical protein LBD75_06535 [Candidatus Peribacteria bacterium]|jgi:ABC-type transport system involved in multi-copper enzyme maturation permease subunit|nr:hypothetical protein [Candidatus Peribacteria bacterium]